MRSDSERNRRRLVKAAAFLVARQGSSVRMADVAERAELSPATAYRHFSSVDEILSQFRYDVGARLLEFSQKSELVGLDRLAAICEFWVRLVVKHGGTMVHARSEEGYLSRLRSGTPYLKVQADALLPAIAQASQELGIEDPGDEALFLWNVLFDPREIFDLLRTVGMTEHHVAQRLFSTFCGALRGWAADRAADLELAGELSRDSA